MKCEHCPYLINVGGYEYPEYDCKFFGYEIPDEVIKEDGEGCIVHHKTLEKLNELHEKIEIESMWGWEYEGRGIAIPKDVCDEHKKKIKALIDEYNSIINSTIKKYGDKKRKRELLKPKKEEVVDIIDIDVDPF